MNVDNGESDTLYNKHQYRNWCWTLNNPTIPEREFWTDMRDNGHERIFYCVFQEEWPHGGQLHYQGYLELKKPMRRSTMKNVFGHAVHWERRKGTQVQAVIYCKKDEDRYIRSWPYCTKGIPGQRIEWGVMKRGGTDRFELAVKAIDTGMTWNNMIDNYPVQTTMHKEKLMDRVLTRLPSRNWAMKIIILVGPYVGSLNVLGVSSDQ